ncbi:MAG: dTDP-4-dehydrorhamnose 3,5-epimerase [Saprospiraceae bacterium]|jgi:dTDP-4-dehydrorhamnose 3,5-epimerase
MEIQEFDIDGLLLIKPKVFGDERGYFFESFNKKRFEEAVGETVNFIQDNESKSSYGVLRGLHFQRPPFNQAKLVRVIEGEVLDVAVDLRANSPTFGQHQSVILTAKNKHQFFVPRGFAHGFLVISETAIFAYKVDNDYAPAHDDGIIFNSESLGIDWTIDEKDIQLSGKDKQLQTFAAYSKSPNF